MSTHKNNYFLIVPYLLSALFLISFFSSFAIATNPSDEIMEIGDTTHTNGQAPYFYGYFDAGGFSDDIYWGQSPNHNHSYHEVLSGEWAAAVYYDDIGTEPDAMWLTNFFQYPDWSTNSDFDSFGASAWNDANNPTPLNNAGRSVIKNNKVEITIDYEVVDLNEASGLGDNSFSPIGLKDANGICGYVKSDRHLFLQTYTIKNVSDGNVSGLEFYQMLHSHGADEYGPCVNASYVTTPYDDALENYTPYNSAHTVGNFRYDFTQWNNLDEYVTADHVDWIGFSTSVEPDVFDVNFYEGHVNGNPPPRPGTHWNVQERNLNGVTYDYGETAGAMGWYLPDLEPNESIAITVAFMFGYGPIETCQVTLTKTDDTNDCAEPYDSLLQNYLNYEICYEALGNTDTNVALIDYLPNEVEYYSSDPCGDYDPCNHTVTWDIGILNPSDSNCFSISVKVTTDANPGSTLENYCELTGDTIDVNATETTCVDCWSGNIIYVDADANGLNNGTSWPDAYNDLQDALEQTTSCPVTAIWVAAGQYKPVNSTSIPNYKDYSFQLRDGVAVLGHFVGNEQYPEERNFADANNKTVLQGKIGQGTSDTVKWLAKAENIEDSLLDGLTIEGVNYNPGGAILISDSNITIVNSIVQQNYQKGIKCIGDSQLSIYNCVLVANPGYSLFVEQSIVSIWDCVFEGQLSNCRAIFVGGSSFSIERCLFSNNDCGAISAENSQVLIKDCNVWGPVYNLSAQLTLGSCSGEILNCVVENSAVRDPAYGINLRSCDNLNVKNCYLFGCYSEGINCQESGNPVITDSIIENCGGGIRSDGSNLELTVERCLIRDNNAIGIYLRLLNTPAIVKNNWIYGNSSYGIRTYNSSSASTIRNNTIVNNGQYGIYRVIGTAPNITNCIIWNPDANDLHDCNATYSCIEDGDAGTGNIANDPCFYNSDANNFHIKFESICKDAATGNYPDETDIDREDRTIYGATDIGADEYYWSAADFDESGYVDFTDYAMLAGSWLTEDANITLDDDNDVDIYDLYLFCKDWLWEKAWEEGWMFCMGGGGDGFGRIFSPQTCAGGLMLSDASESISAMPERLARRVEKFYAVNAFNTVTFLRQKAQAEKEFEKVTAEELVKELINWLDEIWENGDLEDSMTEQEYLDFRKAIEDSTEF